MKWEPDASADTLEAAVFQAIGAASMCWIPVPDGVFDSTRAAEVGDGLVAWIRERYFSDPYLFAGQHE